MNMTGRSRERDEGWTGKRRNYVCRVCAEPFEHDGHQLPEKARICLRCRENPKHQATFRKAMEGR